MTSLSEAYDGPGGSGPSLRRLYLGVGLFVGGTLLVVAGILTAGTSAVTSMGYSLGDARLWGGVLGGVGVPAVMLGVFTVLPSGRTTKAAALVGVSVSLFSVGLFYHAYPEHWIGGPRPELVDLTLPTAGLYFLGAATTFWCLFVGVANFKTRNDPGGTVEMEVTHKGETKVIEVEKDRLSGIGGVGFLGTTPDGEVETQTNEPASGPTGGPAGGPTTSDGGASTGTLSSPMDDRGGASAPGPDDGRAGGAARTAGSTEPTRSSSTGSTPGPTGGTGREASSNGRSASTGGPRGDSSTGPSRGGSSSGSAGRPAGGTGSGSAPADRYCGSCEHFQYVRTEQGMQPYCGLDDELMDSMDACEEWTPR